MKYLASILFIFGICTPFLLMAQDPTGKWNGIVEVQGMKLRIVFNVSKEDDAYTSTMDSPDQGAYDIPMTTTKYDGKTLVITHEMGMEFTGTINEENHLIGDLKQAGLTMPLDLSHDEVAKPEASKRPQDPVAPYPYISEDLTFENKKANITLAGTFTRPKGDGKFPVVVLISGSGPQDRDEALVGHRPFLVLADHLTRNGIAVLRYDDRGTAKSTGDFKSATSFDFADDASAAVDYLKSRKDVLTDNIGLLGHSEGGLIAPIVAVNNKEVDFIILLAGPGIPGGDILLMQGALIAEAMGTSAEKIQEDYATRKGIFEIIRTNDDTEVIREKMTALLDETIKDEDIPAGKSRKETIEGEVNAIISPWMINFIKYDPATTMRKVKCPVLAINGKKDLQVPPTENISAIELALQEGGNTQYTTHIFDGLNHLFQECTTGAPNEYSMIDQTISPEVLEYVSEWIIDTIGKP